MKLGFASAIVPDLSLEEVVAFAAAEGFSCVELMCWPKGKAERRYAGVTHIDVAAFSAGDAAQVQDVMAAGGVEISGLGYYPNPRPYQRGHQGCEATGCRCGQHLHRSRSGAVGGRQLAALQGGLAAADRVRGG